MSNMSHLETMEGVTFQTDRSGVIQAIGANNWNAFAVQNGAPELDADAVVGRSLFDFIEGAQVRSQFRQIMERIAQDPNWAWVLPFRCDAPDRERHIRQYLKPVFPNNVCEGFVFQSIEESTQQRPPIALYDFKRLGALARKDRRLPVLNMCSWCQRVQYAPAGGDGWISAEDYYAAGGRSEVSISHVICDDCLRTKADTFAANVNHP